MSMSIKRGGNSDIRMYPRWLLAQHILLLTEIGQMLILHKGDIWN